MINKYQEKSAQKQTRTLTERIVLLIIISITLGIFLLASTHFFSLNLTSMNVLKLSPIETFELPQECLDKDEGYSKSWSCYEHYFQKITDEASPKIAMEEARRLKAEKVVNDCHLFGHYIGERTLENYNFDLGKAYSSCTAGCSQGCFHGVIERYFQDETDPAVIISVWQDECSGLKMDDDNYFACLHGVGHGLIVHQYLTPKDAFNACSALGSRANGTKACFSGMTMERMDGYLGSDLEESQLLKILPEVCAPFEKLEPDITDICLFYLAEGLLYYTGFDIKHSEELCQGLKRQEYVDQCKQLISTVILDQEPSSIDLQNFVENRHIEILPPFIGKNLK